MFYRSATLVITAAVMGVLAIGAVALRMWVYAKGMRRNKMGADDALIFVGLALALGLCICNIIGAVCFRFGNHEIFIESGPIAGFPVAWLLLGYGKIFYAIQLLHATAMPVIKASLMLFLRRIFWHTKIFRVAFWIIGVYVALWWLTTFWMSVFQCWPISSNWGTDPSQFGDCIPDYMTWYAWAALLNVVSDVAIMTVPIPLVLRLQMPAKQKFAALGIITTAVIVIIAGIGRTVAYFTYDRNSLDFSYVFYYFLLWTSIEPCLGVVGCCLPTLGPLLGLIDMKSSALYLKIKSAFSRQSLLQKTRSQGSSDQATPWIELADKKSSASEQGEVYEGPPC